MYYNYYVHLYNLLSYFRVHLSKRRVRGGAGGVQSAVSQLVVKHRELDDNERKAQVRITYYVWTFGFACL